MRRSFKNYHFKFIKTALLSGLVLAGAFFIILLEDRHEEKIEASELQIQKHRPQKEDRQLSVPVGVKKRDSLMLSSTNWELVPEYRAMGALGPTGKQLTVGNCFPKQRIYLYYGKELKPVRLKNFHQNYLVDSTFLRIPVSSDLYLFIPQPEQETFFYAVKRADFIDMQLFEEVFYGEQFQNQNFRDGYPEWNFSAGFRGN